jgi:serine/threonine-protein kinase
MIYTQFMATKGRYELLEVLGEGGMGIVYRAIDPVMNNRDVAVKTIRDPQDKAALDLFKRECAVLSSITHPNIVDILDIGETEEAGAKRPYFVMPLLPGTTLQELIKSSSPRLTVERSVQMISQVCRGLQAAHEQSLVHRDLKPSNLFILPDDSVKIIDFGMAHLADHRSATGLKGTLLYMAPEQLEFKKQPTPFSDQFSLAVVCYEMLARRHPFSAAGQEDLAQAILHYTPPPVSEFNPLVNPSICQVIHKALAKQPFHRFPDVRAFSECLQKALRGEPIDIFDPARIAPRLARARKAFEAGDLDDAAERIKELESESFLSPEIDELHKQIDEVRRTKTVNQLLETAHRRFEEGEYVRALQKVQEVLNLDSNNTDAFTLLGAIESKRSATQIEEWFRLANQHMENHAYAYARQALEKVLDLRPKEVRAQTLLAEVERREHERIRLRNEKEEAYQSALNAYRRGDVNSAYAKAERLLDLDRRAPYSSSPDQAAAYQKLYEEVRSKRDQLASQEAEARRCLESGDFAAAKSICDAVLIAYPNSVLFCALRDDIEQAHRQEISAYLAKIERDVAVEPDLNRKVAILEEASQKYSSEPRFKDALQQVRSRRDLVDSITGRARTFEEGRQFSEALGLWEMLRGIYPKYPGLEIEIDRLRKRREQQLRAETKNHWVTQIDQAITIRNYAKAGSLVADGLAEFPGDPELSALASQIQQAQARALEAVEKTNRGKDLFSVGSRDDALNMLRDALQLDPHNPVVRAGLLEILLNEASPHIDADWHAAEPLVREALELDPSNAGAKSLSTLIQDKRQIEEVSAALSRARQLQAQSDLKGAIAELDKLRPIYPRENRLIQLRSVLQEGLSAEEREEIRARDLVEVNELAQQAKEIKTINELDSIFCRTGAFSKYGADPEFRKPISEIEDRLRQKKEVTAENPALAAEAIILPPSPVVKSRSLVWTSEFVAKCRAILQRARPRFLWPVAGLVAAALSLIFVARWVLHRAPPAPPPAPLTEIAFKVDPEDATISIDDQVITGNTKKVTPGDHVVRVEKLGFKGVVQRFNDHSPSPIGLTLTPESHMIRVLADNLETAKVLLDDMEIEPLEGGSSGHNLETNGTHTLKLTDGRNLVFSMEFQADFGAPARLISPPHVEARDNPAVRVVSSLGSGAIAYSSLPGEPAGLKDREQKPIPTEGLELILASGGNEVTFSNPKQPLTLAVEASNVPVINIRVGAATRGALIIMSSAVGARVFIDRQQKGSVGVSGWQQPLDAGSHTLQLKFDGYEDSSEQTFTIAAGKTERKTIELTPSVTTAFLQIEGGTPQAQIFLDDNQIGTLDGNGSLGPVPVKPNVDHVIQFKKTNFEDSARFTRRASVKQTITIRGAESRLTPFGTLVFTTISPSETQLSIQRRGTSQRQVADKANPIPLQEGTYTVHAAAGDQYDTRDDSVQIRSGQPTNLAIRLTLKQPETATPPPKEIKAPPPPPAPQLTELFGDLAKNWKPDDKGFWSHDGTTTLKEKYFTHTFDALLKKSAWNRNPKLQWKTALNDSEYYEFELDDKTFRKRKAVGGKNGAWEQQPHGIQEGPFRVQMTVRPDGIVNTIGRVNDVVNENVDGNTGFKDKINLKLIQ